MRASNGTLTTVLMFVPLLAVPLLAIFGTPQFTPSTASTPDDVSADPLGLDLGVGQSDRPAADDLFAPVGERRDASSERMQDIAELPASSWSQPDESLPREPFAEAAPRHAMLNRSTREEPAETASVSPDWPQREERPSAEWYAEQPERREADRTASTPQETTLDVNTGAIDSGSFLSIDDNPREERSRPQPASRSPFSTTRNPAAASELGSHATQPMGRAFADSQPSAPSRGPQHDQPFASGSGDRPAASDAGEQALTWRDAVRQLNALGVRDYQLGPGAGEHAFHFSCQFAPADNPRVLRRFESEANEPLAAVADVIRQVEGRRGQP